MNIREEYSRLCSFAVSKERWQEIEDAWMVASNYRKIGTEWVRERASAGQNVTSFAVDLRKWRHKIGERGADHYKAKSDLIVAIVNQDLKNWSEIESDVIEGRMAHIPEWKYPLVTFCELWVFQDVELLKILEEKVLELEIGLPIISLVKKFQ